MITTKFRLSYGLLLLAGLGIALLYTNCGKKASKVPSAQLSRYLYAYTSGGISRTSPITVQFAQPVVSVDMFGKSAEGLLSLSPSVEGNAFWKDVQTLVFQPKDFLPSGTNFTASLQLNKLFKDKDAPSEFNWEFRVRPQTLQVAVEGIMAEDTRNLSNQMITGTVESGDVSTPEEVEKVLRATQNGNALNIQWSHESNQTLHRFTVVQVKRTDTPGSVQLSWDGKSIGAESASNTNVEIPGLSDFKLMNAAADQGEDQRVQLIFSDPLDPAQDLSGLIGFSNYNGGIKFTIDGNRVYAYPEQRLRGTVTVQANPGIKNTLGKKMSNASTYQLTMIDVSPAVKLVGHGVVMPNTSGLLFPFEAVNLEAIDVEITKIYSGNVLQFLQVNSLDGNNEMHRVGDIVLQKKILLKDLGTEARLNRWTRYALDLSTLIQADPQSMYVVTLGFRRSYANVACKDDGAVPDGGAKEMEGFETDSDGFPVSITDNYYGSSGWFEDYDWDNRSNPCRPEYYNSERTKSRNILASNLGLVAKQGEDGKITAVCTDLITARPIAGVEIEAFSYQLQSLGKVSSSAEGLAKLELKKKARFLVANYQKQRGYLKLDDGDALSLSSFDIEGAAVEKGMKGFTYGERGVWRPGDSLFVHFVLEDKNNKLPEQYPIQVEFRNPRGQIQANFSTSNHLDRVYPIRLATSPDAPTGDWLLTVKAGGATFTKNLKVENVKPNRLKIKLNTGGSLVRGTLPVAASLQVNWLHGAPAKGLKAKVEATLLSDPAKFTNHPEYVWTDPSRNVRFDRTTLFDNVLNQEGAASFPLKLIEDKTSLPGNMKARIYLRAFEKGGDFSQDQDEIKLQPFQTLVGLKLPSSRWGEHRFDQGKKGNIQVLTVDPDGQPQPRKKLQLAVYRISWNWWWEHDHSNLSEFNTMTTANTVLAEELTTDASGKLNFGFQLDQWGRYLVRIYDPVGGHATGDFLYVGYPWDEEDEDGDSDNLLQRQQAAMLSFRTDKKAYKTGEKATITVPSSQGGYALISLENGRGVQQTEWVALQANETNHSFPITAAMAPTCYVHVHLIQPHRPGNDAPIRMYGVLPLEVEDPNTHLQPQVQLADELRPETNYSVTVSEQAGKAMTYTLAVVEEGLLDLTRFKTPDPWKHFYAREALNVKTWDMFDYVLGGYSGQLDRVLSIGGDDALGKAEGPVRANRFKPVVTCLGPFQLKPGQKMTHQLQMPNYIGSVRVMVVASKSGAYGAAEKAVPVRKPLMMLATLPRRLAIGESLNLPIDIFAMDKKVKDVQVTVKESSGLIKLTNPTQSISFSSIGDKMVTVPISTATREGIAKFTITATGGGENASQEIEVDVVNPNPPATTVLAGQVNAGATWTQAYAISGSDGAAMLEVSSIPPINLGDRLHYLLNYPYGCVEQTTSGAFPQLFVSNFTQLSEMQKKITASNVNAALERLKGFQTAEGAFGYWPGDRYWDNWSTSYVGHFLLEAKAKGYPVTDIMLNRWVDFQAKMARAYDADFKKYAGWHAADIGQAYRLYTLAMARKPELGAMNRFREDKRLTLVARYLLASAYALSGKQEVASDLLRGVDASITPYTEMSYSYGSDLRDYSVLLMTALHMNDQNKAFEHMRTVSQLITKDRSWYSTQSLGWALMAAGAYIEKYNKAQPLEFAWRTKGGNWTNAGASAPIFQASIPADGGQIEVKNTSGGPLFARVIMRGRPLPGTETNYANGVKMSVRYLDMTGNPINVNNLAQGTDFVAEVKVIHGKTQPRHYPEMALEQVFPSGWEIINSRLFAAAGSPLQSSPFDYQDIRDDRVITFFDLYRDKEVTYHVQLNAAYNGKFWLPSTVVEGMYDRTVGARASGGWVVVGVPEG